MAVRGILAQVFCSNIEISAEWYAHLMGRLHDFAPDEDTRIWYLDSHTALHLIENPVVVGDGRVILRVSQLQREIDRLGLGGELRQDGSGATVLRMVDPDGNVTILMDATEV